jgi:hypothetical protein
LGKFFNLKNLINSLNYKFKIKKFKFTSFKKLIEFKQLIPMVVIVITYFEKSKIYNFLKTYLNNNLRNVIKLLYMKGILGPRNIYIEVRGHQNFSLIAVRKGF